MIKFLIIVLLLLTAVAVTVSPYTEYNPLDYEDEESENGVKNTRRLSCELFSAVGEAVNNALCIPVCLLRGKLGGHCMKGHCHCHE